MNEVPEAMQAFAERYTAAWCSQKPEDVAAHFSTTGWLAINGGAPAIGHEAISEVAQSFMSAFPDLHLAMDRLVSNEGRIEFHWTLQGTNTGIGGTGKRVHISGFESWLMGHGGLIDESQGHFDSDLYRRQLEDGVEGHD